MPVDERVANVLTFLGTREVTRTNGDVARLGLPKAPTGECPNVSHLHSHSHSELQSYSFTNSHLNAHSHAGLQLLFLEGRNGKGII